MIKLDPMEKDALIEICNLGMSKAAKQLSVLLGSKINITIPSIHLMSIKEFKQTGFLNTNESLSFVYQTLQKEMKGRAVLVFKTSQTKNLTDSVIGENSDLTDKEEKLHEQEAMIEIGNIIISACISAIVNMLKINVNLSVPSYNENEIDALIDKQLNAVEDCTIDAFIIKTDLTTVKESISGNLLLVLSSDSVELLINEIKKLFGTSK